MTQNDVNSARTVNYIGKEELLELLSKKLGCSSEEVSFLFQGIDKPTAPQDLTIPDGRALP